MKEELENVKQNIASKLRGLRAEKGLTQDEISTLTGLDNVTLGRYENGKVTQSLDKLIVLANFYNVSLLYFFTQNYENMYRNSEQT